MSHYKLTEDEKKSELAKIQGVMWGTDKEDYKANYECATTLAYQDFIARNRLTLADFPLYEFRRQIHSWDGSGRKKGRVVVRKSRLHKQTIRNSDKLSNRIAELKTANLELQKKIDENNFLISELEKVL